MRDNNSYTQFSKNNELIIQFFSNYFENEAQAGDFKKFLEGMLKYVDHPQLIVSLFKVMSNIKKAEKFITEKELKMLYEYITKFRWDLVFSNRYLCFKYIMRILVSQTDPELIKNEMFSSFLLAVIGQMPFEIFSTSD